jgi:hypothetical protein
MAQNMTVTINEQGHAVITQEMPLVEYCLQRMQALRAMTELVGSAHEAHQVTGAAPVALVKPLLALIRGYAEEFEPLVRALDQRAYEKGFEDGKTIGMPLPTRLPR